MSKILRPDYLVSLLIFASGVLVPAQAQQSQSLTDCNTGSYTLTDGSLLDISTAPAGIAPACQQDAHCGDGAWIRSYVRSAVPLTVPQLWVIAGDDTEAPPDTTVNRLRALKRDGKPITVLEFPNTDHGIVEFVEIDGNRISTRVADGYLKAVADFAKHGQVIEPGWRVK